MVLMSDLSSLLSTLDQKRQELTRIESELKQAQSQRLGNLAAELGFKDTDELIRELAAFASAKLAAAIRNEGEILGRDTKRSHRLALPPRKRRAVVNSEMRDKLGAELKARTRTAAEIATMFGVSASLVNQVKRSLGLVQKRR
jgi:hypothetical protein